jgi:hypothetical protein
VNEPPNPTPEAPPIAAPPGDDDPPLPPAGEPPLGVPPEPTTFELAEEQAPTERRRGKPRKREINRKMTSA